MVAGIWTHLAAVRTGSTLSFYVNGILNASTTISSAIFTSSLPFYIGTNGEGTSAWCFGGSLSNVRIVKGTGVYNSAFTPPTVPLTAIAGTVLLTCQSNRFIDNSSNKFVSTITGNPQIIDYSPFPLTSDLLGVGGSYYSATKSNYLTVPTTVANNSFTGDFTVESWVYPSDTTVTNHWGIADFRSGAGVGSDWILFLINYSGGWNLSFYQTGYDTGTIKVLPNQWTHVAVSRVGSTLSLYVNGVLDTSFTKSGTIGTGAGSTDYLMNSWDVATAGNGQIGYISDLRIVNGTAVYTGAFTPPTTMLKPITNTTLLLNCQNAGIVDKVGGTDLTITGTPSVSTTVAKFSKSIYFDGSASGQITTNTSKAYALGSDDFTMEFWYNPSTQTS